MQTTWRDDYLYTNLIIERDCVRDVTANIARIIDKEDSNSVSLKVASDILQLIRTPPQFHLNQFGEDLRRNLVIDGLFSTCRNLLSEQFLPREPLRGLLLSLHGLVSMSTSVSLEEWHQRVRGPSRVPELQPTIADLGHLDLDNSRPISPPPITTLRQRPSTTQHLEFKEIQEGAVSKASVLVKQQRLQQSDVRFFQNLVSDKIYLLSDMSLPIRRVLGIRATAGGVTGRQLCERLLNDEIEF